MQRRPTRAIATATTTTTTTTTITTTTTTKSRSRTTAISSQNQENTTTKNQIILDDGLQLVVQVHQPQPSGCWIRRIIIVIIIFVMGVEIKMGFHPFVLERSIQFFYDREQRPRPTQSQTTTMIRRYFLPPSLAWNHSNRTAASTTTTNTTTMTMTTNTTTNTTTIQCNPQYDCVDPLGIKGEWVDVGITNGNSNKTFAAPVCCGWDDRHYASRPLLCGTLDMNVDMKQRHHGRTKFYQLIGGKACTCQNPPFLDRYVWQAPGLPQFDPNRTCHLLGKRRVLMIGDSTMQQTAATLMNALFPIGCQTQITFVIGDTLIQEDLGRYNRGQHWITTMNSFQPRRPDIVIVGTGSHILSEANFTRVVQEVVTDMVRFMKQQQQTNRTNPQHRTTFLWKTQQPAGGF